MACVTLLKYRRDRVMGYPKGMGELEIIFIFYLNFVLACIGALSEKCIQKILCTTEKKN